MNKIIRYELHRMVCSKIFAGMALVLVWYGWQVLNGVTILGVAYTAPFSPWSFGAYLCSLMPLLSLSFLFFLWETCSGPAKRVEILAAATGFGHGKLMFAKGCAAALAWLILAAGVSLLGTGFLLNLFGSSAPVGGLMAAAVLVLAPVLLFFMGFGLLAGRYRTSLVFLIIPAVIFFVAAPLPMEAQLFCRTFFNEWPKGLGLDPEFFVPGPFLAGRILFGAAGVFGAAAAAGGKK